MQDGGEPLRSLADEIAAAAEQDEIETGFEATEKEVLRQQAQDTRKRAAELGAIYFSRLAGELQAAAAADLPILVSGSRDDADSPYMDVRWQGREPRKVRFAVHRSTGELQIWAFTDRQGRLTVRLGPGFRPEALDPIRDVGLRVHSVDPLDPGAETELRESVSWVWAPGDRVEP
jgi:hypothetical protein